MSNEDDRSDGRGSRYKPGNVTDDGNYRVGKNRPPETGKFRKDDGRSRGRRPKGTRNFTTLLAEELNSRTTIVENGSTKKISKLHSIIKRQLDNAARGQNAALQLLYMHVLPLLDADASSRSSNIGQDDLAIIQEFFERRLTAQAGDDLGNTPTGSDGDETENGE